MSNTIKVLAYMDSEWVQGPPKSLLQFARSSGKAKDGLPGIEISLVVPHRGEGRLQTPFVEAAESAGLHVDVVRESGPYDLRVVPQLRAMAHRVQPDILETHNVKPNFLMLLSGLWRRYPWIAFHHGYTWTNFRVHAYNQLDRASFRAAKQVVTVCDAFVHDLVRRGISRRKIAVQYPAITPYGPLSVEAEAKVAELRRMVGPDTRIAVSVGRLSREKGHLTLIRGWGQMRRRWPEERVHLVVVGEGPERAKIEAELMREGLAGNVTLVGLQLEVQPYYEVADLLVLPSDSEGPAHVLLEAMVTRRPIAATKVGGIPEVVTDETALLVEPGDPDSLADAMYRALHLTEEKRQRMVKDAEADALAFTPERYRRSLIALYQKVLLEG
ncbi:MAG: glycosyltransferase [Bryobacteraceae bacterium]